ncbi:hypothetical protein CHS0354_039408 [Potamilus streckersoni]|uniref:Uncharacterized protein n=1 Tax=Potamilus streckersoni TaxID=2493646 RepID=A0AAE0VMQ4_9BIVA|nr:hypothetical protein CHS0354_039408 [Potamilus streckersoni]
MFANADYLIDLRFKLLELENQARQGLELCICRTNFSMSGYSPVSVLACDDVQLEMETTNDVSNVVTFRWEVRQWDAVQKVYVNITGSLKTQTGVHGKGIHILKESFVAGKKYLITAHIYISSTTQHGTAANIWYINEIPYGGTCILDKQEGEK